MEPISQEYLIQLRGILVEGFSEQELRDICFNLSVDYESLEGDGKAAKARELIYYLDRRGRILELVKIGKPLRPQLNWEDASKRKRYYIASDMSAREVFNLNNGGDLERTLDHNLADFIVLDLCRPPQDWFKYVKRRPLSTIILFAEKLPEADPVELDGKSILAILERACGFSLRVWGPQEGLLNALNSAKYAQIEATEEEQVIRKKYANLILAAVR